MKYTSYLECLLHFKHFPFHAPFSYIAVFLLPFNLSWNKSQKLLNFFSFFSLCFAKKKTRGRVRRNSFDSCSAERTSWRGSRQENVSSLKSWRLYRKRRTFYWGLYFSFRKLFIIVKEDRWEDSCLRRRKLRWEGNWDEEETKMKKHRRLNQTSLLHQFVDDRTVFSVVKHPSFEAQETHKKKKCHGFGQTLKRFPSHPPLTSSVVKGRDTKSKSSLRDRTRDRWKQDLSCGRSMTEKRRLRRRNGNQRSWTRCGFVRKKLYMHVGQQKGKTTDVTQKRDTRG